MSTSETDPTSLVLSVLDPSCPDPLRAWEALVDASSERGLDVKLFKFPGLLPFASKALDADAKTQLLVWSFLANISNSNENKIGLCTAGGFVEAAMRAVNGEGEEIREEAMRFLLNLTISAQVAEAMRGNKRMVELLLQETKKRKPDLQGVMALANIVDERMIRAMNINIKSLLDIADLLGVILDGSDKDIEDMWTLAEPLFSLRSLCIGDMNRAIIFNKKPDFLKNLLKSGIKAAEQSDWPAMDLAMQCLAQFAFDKEPLVLLREDEDMAKLLTIALAVPSNEVKKSAQVLVFKIRGEGDKLTSSLATSTSSSDRKKLVMSYAWGALPTTSQEAAQNVETHLINRGFLIWRDTTKNAMKTNLAEAMAEAVLRSNTLVVVVSKTYKNSVHCKAELVFARKCKKRLVALLADPGYDFAEDGWLGHILAGAYVYDISNKATFEKTMDTMIAKELGGVVSSVGEASLSASAGGAGGGGGGNGGGGGGLVVSKQHSNLSTSSMASSASAAARRVPNSEKEVRLWLKMNDLNDIADLLVGEGYVNAQALKSLAEVSMKDAKDNWNMPSAKYTMLRHCTRRLFE